MVAVARRPGLASCQIPPSVAFGKARAAGSCQMPLLRGVWQGSLVGEERLRAWTDLASTVPRPPTSPSATTSGKWQDAAPVEAIIEADGTIRPTMADHVPTDLFLEAFPPPIRALALELRGLVRAAEPDLLERVRSGWALIGYDAPVGRSKRYVGFIAPEREHIHLGFEVGTLMAPRPELEGAHLGLRKVRFVTWRPGDSVDAALVRELVREAVAIARMSAGERSLLAEARRSG